MIYITRHGQTNWNIQNKVMGKKDEPLNEVGLNQAEQVSQNLKNTKIDLIISSPLIRARETAIKIGKDRNIPIIYDERIIERDFGEFEGHSRYEFDFEEFWDYYKNKTYDKAENIESFVKRIYEFLDEVTEKYEDKDILLVTHGGVSLIIDCYFKERIPKGSLIYASKLDNCEVKSYEIHKNNKRY